MAANYWESTQRRHWLFSKEQLEERRKHLEREEPQLVQAYTLPQLRHLSIYFNQQLNRLGKRLLVRQQAIATAQLYLRRFYTKIEIRRTNPYLVLATALYLACKMEETPQHIRLVVSEARTFWPEFLSTDTSKLGECEFFLISEMSSHMIVHQPYRSLASLSSLFGLSQEESAAAWSVVNDSYMTDLPLLHTPHVIALAAVFLALVLRSINNGGGGGGNTVGAGAGAAGAAAAAGGGGGGGLDSPASAAGAAAGSANNNIAAAAQAALMGAAAAASAKAGGGSGHHYHHQQQQQQQQQQGGPLIGATAASGTGGGLRTRLQKLSAWLAESDVDIEGVVDCTQEMISFYDCHEQYVEKVAREQINRFVKARGLDK